MILWDKIIYHADGPQSLPKIAEDFLSFLTSCKVYTPCCMGQHVRADSPHRPEIVFVLLIVTVVGKLV